MENQVVVFGLADEYYGMDIAKVEGIIKMQTITSVAKAPDYVEGVVTLRGEVLPVIDLRELFAVDAAEETLETRIIVVDMGAKKVGLIVDSVTEVMHISEEAIEPPSPIVASAETAFIKGIAKIEDKLIILVNLDVVFSPKQLKTVHAVPSMAKLSETVVEEAEVSTA